MTGSQKTTARYWKRGTRRLTKRIFPISSIMLENSGSTLLPIACSAVRVSLIRPSTKKAGAATFRYREPFSMMTGSLEPEIRLSITGAKA